MEGNRIRFCYVPGSNYGELTLRFMKQPASTEANVFQANFQSTIPMIMPTTIILLLLSVGGIFKGNFDMFYNLVGSNGLLYNYTDVIDTLTFRALISSNDFGMSAAVGLYQSVLCFYHCRNRKQTGWSL